MTRWPDDRVESEFAELERAACEHPWWIDVSAMGQPGALICARCSMGVPRPTWNAPRVREFYLWVDKWGVDSINKLLAIYAAEDRAARENP